jgi:hypothetical protein
MRYPHGTPDGQVLNVTSSGLKSEDGYSSKQTVFGSDSETTRYALPFIDVRRVCVDYALPAAIATGVRFCGVYRLLISLLPTIKIYPTTKTIFGLVGHAVQKLYFLNKDSARHWQWS